VSRPLHVGRTDYRLKNDKLKLNTIVASQILCDSFVRADVLRSNIRERQRGSNFNEQFVSFEESGEKQGGPEIDVEG
jgi:hypothetical protein